MKYLKQKKTYMLGFKKINILYENFLKIFFFIVWQAGRLLIFNRLSVKKINKESFLIICGNRIGDTILTLPSIRALKTKYPNSKLFIIVWSNNIKEVLQLLSYAHKIIVVHSLSEYFNAIFKIRKEKIKVLISFSQSLYLAVANVFSGIKYRLGAQAIYKTFFGLYQIKNYYWLYQNGVPKDENLYLADYFLQMISPLGIQQQKTEIPFLNLSPIFLKQKFVTLKKRCGIANDYIVFQVYAEDFSNLWQKIKWVKLCEYFGQRYQIIFTGNKGCYEYIQAIIKKVKCKNVINISGKTSIVDMIIILNYARAYVGIDTSISHIAVALAKPILIIFSRANFRNYIPSYPNENICYLYPKSNLYPFYSPYFVPDPRKQECPYTTESILYTEAQALLKFLLN